MSTPAGFFERWSRLKRQGEAAPADDAAAAVPTQEVVVAPAVSPADAVSEVSDEAVQPPAPAVTNLPKLEGLDLSADFSGFLKKEVSESLRRSALRKLFNDPHFNRMDGLDIYIDDYSRSDPIPPEMMKTLRQFRTYLSDEKDEDADRGVLGEPESTPQLERAAADGDAPGTDDVPPSIEPETSGQDCDSLGRMGQVVPEDDEQVAITQKIEDSDA